MIRLYEGGGSREIDIVGGPRPREEWASVRQNVGRLLRARKADLAAKLLEEVPFNLCDGTNFFGDEFSVLLLTASLEQYAAFGEQHEDLEARSAYRSIAETMTEVGPYVRFIAVELDTKAGPIPVASPSLAVTSDAVERSLADCEQLIHSRGPTSGVDRLHTAFHGYLRAVCDQSGIRAEEDAGLTQLFKLIREQHPAFIIGGPRAGDIDRIVKAMATILDSLNPVRNKATLAHPNESVLEEAEAMLVINGVRTLLHYLDSKLGSVSSGKSVGDLQSSLNS
jgi:hypothetical protein